MSVMAALFAALPPIHNASVAPSAMSVCQPYQFSTYSTRAIGGGGGCMYTTIGGGGGGGGPGTITMTSWAAAGVTTAVAASAAAQPTIVTRTGARMIGTPVIVCGKKPAFLSHNTARAPDGGYP